MATPIIMPRQGQSVESCIIAAWKKQAGERVAEGEIICDIETDKALIEVESPVAGEVLALFFEEGDEVPVLTNIAVVGQPGEPVDEFRPDQASAEEQGRRGAGGTKGAVSQAAPAAGQSEVVAAAPHLDGGRLAISPRARQLAEREGLDASQLGGSGPGGRIIERDVQTALAERPKLTPLARSMATQGGFSLPPRGSGVSGRVMAKDLTTPPPEAPGQIPVTVPAPDEVEMIPVKGIRKLIAERMLASLQTTAQLTLNASAEARALQAYRQRLKNSAESWGLQGVTLNDLILFVVSRLLPRYPELNALFEDETIARYKNANLAFAVDTPRGLLVPVIRRANSLSLKQLAEESQRLANACLAGNIAPDELKGGTFTVTNLGSFGVESFTPILNPPQVAILGVGNINLKPVERAGQVEFSPHLGLSLTINHQVVDGAPGARFLQAVAQGLAELELLLAL